MSRRGRIARTLLIAAGCLAAAAIFYVAFPTNPTKPDAPDSGEPVAAYDPWTPRSTDGFVGSGACQECHEEISERYETSHPMALALRPLEQNEDIQSGDNEVTTFKPLPGREYDIVRKDGKVRHVERGVDLEGNTLFTQGFDVQYILGSGARGRSYMLERDGQLFASPVSWYSTTQSWDLSPGYQASDHPRFDRRLGERCLGCHSGRRQFAEHPQGNEAKYASPTFLELGIGCERCHGPGKEHVAFHRENRTASTDPIVNPVKLPPAQRDAVCNQCHFQGEFLFYRPGRTDSDFRPGDVLSDIWLIYSKAGAEGKGADDAVRHPEQMYASVCYQQSNGRMSCVSCHDPHYRPKADEVAIHYRARCLSCHNDESCTETKERQLAAPASGSCIHCHMPRRATGDIPHTSQTDHRVPKRPDPNRLPSASGLLAEQADPSRVELFTLDDETVPQAVRDRGEGMKLSRLAPTAATKAQQTALATGAVEKLVVATTAAPNDVEAWDYLAQAYFVLGDTEKASEAWRAAAKVEPDHVPSLNSLLILAQTESRFDDAEAMLKRLIELEPWKSRWRLELAIMLDQLGGRTPDALKYAREAVSLNPTDPEAYPLTIKLLRRMGKSTEANELTQRVRRVAEVEQRQKKPPEQGSTPPEKPGQNGVQESPKP